MKKILKSVFAIAIAALAFTSCDDVPMPYDKPSVNTGGTTYEGAVGTGTLADPYNVAGVLTYISTLEAGVESEQAVYIKGKVASIEENYDGQYKNATFNITDEGTTHTFTVYRANYLNNQKYSTGEVLKIGDEVVVYGNVVNFKGTTPETAQGKSYLYSLNGVGGGGGGTSGEPSGNGTEDSPFNVAAAIAKCKEIGTTVSADSYYVKGIVNADATTDTNYNNITFDMVDAEGGEKFKAFQVKVLDGMTGVKKGDEVVVYGPIYNYSGNTPETAGKSAAKIVSYNNNGGSTPTPQPTGENLLTNGDFEAWTGGLPDNWKSTSTASNATLSQSNDARGGSYAVLVTKGGTANKRLAYKEIALKAGTYTFSFYAKSTTTDPSQSQAGYVPVTNGAVGKYVYGGYTTLSNTSWTQVTTTFTLESEATVCLVMMNPKNSDYATSQDILVDDATLTTADGGLADGNDGGDSGNTGDVQTVTVAQFNAAAESTTVWYQLTGTVQNLQNGTYNNSTKYGNFDLVDETGSVYVYGVLATKGGTKGQFETLMQEKGITDGSTITIIGNRGSYQGKIEVTNAYFVSVSN